MTVAAAFAVAIAGFSGGGAQATNTTTTRTKAFIANSTLVESNLAVKLTADDRSTISATLPVISATLGLVGGAGAVSLTTNTIGAEVDAYIDGSKVTVTAGNVEITATSHATVTADTLTIAVAIAIGIAGGVSDAKVFVNGHTQAYLGRLAEVVADAGLVKIIATSSSTATATVDGGGGTIGVTVQSFRGEAQTNTTTRASVGDGSIIHALDADLTATATNTPSATVTTTAVGLVSSGGVIVIAKDTSTVEAYIGAATGTTSTAGRTAAVTATGSGSTIDVKASLIAPITATGSVLSISLGAGSKTESEATATQTVRAYVGDGGAPNASGGGNVNLAANANTQVAAKGTGVAVGLGVGYGGATVTATLNPIVKTFTEGTSSIGGDDVTLTSTLNQTDVGAPIKQTVDGDEVGPSYAKVTLGAGGLGAGIAGGTVNSYNSPTVVTGVGSSTTVTATGDVVIQSKVFQLAETNGLSIAVAVGVGVGTVVAIATASGSTTTHFDGTLNGGADSLTVQGTVKATSNSSGRAVGGAILGAFTGPTIKAETKPNVTTRLGGTITASGDIVAKSDVTTAAIAVGSAFTVSLLVAIAKVNVDAIDSPTVGTSVSAGSVITSTGGDVTISALHNFPYPTTPTDLTKGAHASADIKGGGTISVGDTDVDATAGANVDTTVAATATLRALATDGLHGVIEVIARSSNIADARVKSATGGVIDISIANPTATASGPDPTDATKTCATEGGCTTANMLGNVLASGGGAGARRLSVLAEGSAVTSSNLDTRGGGLIKITTGSTALAESKPTVTTTVGGSNSTIVTSGNIDVQATGITDADASATTVSGGFVNVALFSSTAKTQPNVNVVVAASSTLGSGGTITIGASHNPVTQALSDGSFTAPGAVDTANGRTGNTISFTLPHGLQSGDVVTYNAQIVNPLTDFVINGLVDGRQYGVIVVDNDTLQLGAVFSGAQVDTVRDEIRFGSLVPDPPASNGTLPGTSTFVSAPHNLETGDAVYYWAPASGGTGVGGLISGKRYIVYVVDATTLKLLDPLTMATNPIESVSFNAGAVNGTSIDATNGFQNGDAVTYHAPPSRTFSSAAVELAVDGAGQPQRNSDNTPIYAGAGDDTIFLGSNPDSDGVFQTGHGYSTGDQITYKVDCPSGVATCKNVFGATVADGTTVTRFVIRIDNFRIKLAASKCHATGAGADCATTTVNGALQTLPRATFNVASTAAFAASGSFTVGGVIGTCSYGGKTATAFTDVTGCIGTPSNGATVTATNQPNQPLALDPDRTTDGTKVVHTIKRTNDAPLTGLVDGQVYFVVGTPTATSFQISASRNGTALNADNNLDGGLHTFAIEGVDLTSVGAGDQSLVLDLTTQGAGKQRLDGVGGGGTLAGAPSGDGIATASGSGSGGGVVDVKTATSTATVTPKLSNTIGGSAQLTALNIEIKTDNRGRVSAISSNGGGGLVTIGQADATATLNATTTISIASSAILTAANSLTVDASATVGANAKAGTQSAGLGAGVHANATATMNYTTTATIDGTLTAGGKLTLKSRTAITGNADASAQGGGLGVDSDATAVVNIGTGEADSTNAVTRTTIKAGARLSGDKVEIDAIIDSLYARSVAKSVADAFGADSDATATVNANGVAEVLLETKSAAAGYQIIGNQAVWLQALYDNVNVSTSSDAACNCFAGDATARSDVYYDTLAKVTGRNESFIETADLTVDANQNRDRYDKHANAHGGAFVGHHEPRDGDFNAYRRIYWETTTIMLGEPNPVLVVDQNGKITKLVNVTVKDELGNSYALDSIIPVGREIHVGDIQYNSSGFVRFRANKPTGAPDSEIWGNAGLFDFQETWDYVQILNSSDRKLVTHLIDVVNGANSAIIRIDVNHVPGGVDSPANNQSISESGASGSTFEFDIVHSFVPTLVEIRNLQPGSVASSDIVLEGRLTAVQSGEEAGVTIENPIGTTIVDNRRGNIVVSSSATLPFRLLRTNILTLNADTVNVPPSTGSIGTHTTSGGVITGRAPIPIELVQYLNAAGALKPITITVEAAVDAVLDLRAVRRESTSASMPFAVTIGSFRAGHDVDLVIQDTYDETATKTLAAPVVGTFAPPTSFSTPRLFQTPPLTPNDTC